MGYQALPVYLDLLVPKVLPARVAKEEEKEPQVLLDPRENEAAEDCQDPPDQQACLVNQHNVKQVQVMDVSWVRLFVIELSSNFCLHYTTEHPQKLRHGRVGQPGPRHALIGQ